MAERRDAYTLVGAALFAVTVLFRWRGYFIGAESIYLLGPWRIADPEFLALDLTWSDPSSTTFLFDHLLAPLWWLLSPFAIVSLGRFLTWFLFAWSLSMLARTLRLPPWSVVVGYSLWLLAGESLGPCGAPLLGFQPKSLAYPLAFFALTFVLRRQPVRAGLAAGLATAFHIIIGGWASVGLLACMLADLRRFPPRRIAAFLLASAPFVLPNVLAVMLFHTGGASGDELALMNRIYVDFAWPVCCDATYFLVAARHWVQLLAVLAAAPLLIGWGWREGPARLVAVFLAVLALQFLVGACAAWLDWYWLLKLFPFQLALSLPLLFLFLFTLATFTAERWPRTRGFRVVWLVSIVVCFWVADAEDVERELRHVPEDLALEALRDGPPCYGKRTSSESRELYAWIKGNTPRDSIFISPYLPGFWNCAERAQVVSLRHSPQDRKLIDWMDRLHELNGQRPFENRGFETEDELNENQGRLGIDTLTRMHRAYGATHYLVLEGRADLEPGLVFANDDYAVYDLSRLGL